MQITGQPLSLSLCGRTLFFSMSICTNKSKADRDLRQRPGHLVTLSYNYNFALDEYIPTYLCYFPLPSMLSQTVFDVASHWYQKSVKAPQAQPETEDKGRTLKMLAHLFHTHTPFYPKPTYFPVRSVRSDSLKNCFLHYVSRERRYFFSTFLNSFCALEWAFLWAILFHLSLP